MHGTFAVKDDMERAAHAELFKRVSSHWPSGVAVITTRSKDGASYGLTMSALVPLSLDPMQFLISVDKRSTTLPAIKESGTFCINFLQKSQADLGKLFASKVADKLEQVEHHISDWGPPVITGAVSSIVCDVHSVLPGGDHDLIVGNVMEMIHAGGDPLVYFNKAFASLEMPSEPNR